MSSQLDAAIVQLLSNPRDVAKIALDTLCNLARNCIHKKEEKYHRIKMSNAAVKRKLLDVPGSTACLVALGFTEGTCEGEPAWLGPKGNKDMLYDGVARLGEELDRLLDIPVDTNTAPQGPGGLEGMLIGALQNPAMLQRFLPMMRANPGMVDGMLQNPSAQATLAERPDLVQQLEGMLGRPLPFMPSAQPQSLQLPPPVDAQSQPLPLPTPAAAQPQSLPLPPRVVVQPQALQTHVSAKDPDFEPQFAHLREMGFVDRDRCIGALRAADGDLELALAALCGER
mmetsp:Transcript_10130/g.26009  ORF Transcript_10130/g.26009 Transcript_10130/m.26009 type:complete len:284 (-) Transcript_10130:155-1006(-)